MCSFLRPAGLLVTLFLALQAPLPAVLVAVTAAGKASQTTANWGTAGLFTLDGDFSGVNWQRGGYSESPVLDWTFDGQIGQGADFLPGEKMQWANGSSIIDTEYGWIRGFIMGAGGGLEASVTNDPRGDDLYVSLVSLGAADYTVNGVTQTSTGVGEILTWKAVNDGTNLDAGNTWEFSSTLPGGETGAVGFSTIPEPSLAALAGIGLLLIGKRRRR